MLNCTIAKVSSKRIVRNSNINKHIILEAVTIIVFVYNFNGFKQLLSAVFLKYIDLKTIEITRKTCR